jgi:hypothetical protein
MARTKVSIHPYRHLKYIVAHRRRRPQQTARKSTGGPLSLINFFTLFTEIHNHPSSGKAPRKQLATKAARKTATVSSRRRATVVGTVVLNFRHLDRHRWCKETPSLQARNCRSS